jgi:cell shape-determining protein MreC
MLRGGLKKGQKMQEQESAKEKSPYEYYYNLMSTVTNATSTIMGAHGAAVKELEKYVSMCEKLQSENEILKTKISEMEKKYGVSS